MHHTRSTESAHRKTVRFHTSLQLDAAFTNSPVIIRHYCNGTAQLEQSTALAPAKTYAIVKVGRQIDGNEAAFLFWLIHKAMTVTPRLLIRHGPMKVRPCKNICIKEMEDNRIIYCCSKTSFKKALLYLVNINSCCFYWELKSNKPINEKILNVSSELRTT